MAEIDSVAALRERACEWVAAWMQKYWEPWDGPDEVVIHTRTLVVALGCHGPFEFVAPHGERVRLRVAPGDSPPATVRIETDDGSVEVLSVVYVPPALAHRRVEEGGA